MGNNFIIKYAGVYTISILIVLTLCMIIYFFKSYTSSTSELVKIWTNYFQHVFNLGTSRILANYLIKWLIFFWYGMMVGGNLCVMFLIYRLTHEQKTT